MPEDERDEAYEQIALMREKIDQIGEARNLGHHEMAAVLGLLLKEAAEELYAELDKLARAQAAREGQS